MNLKVLVRFFDVEEKVIREPNEVFKASEKRANKLLSHPRKLVKAEIEKVEEVTEEVKEEKPKKTKSKKK